MVKRNAMLSMTVLALSSFMVSSAQAQRGGRGPDHEPGQGLERALNRLDLSDDQKENIGKIREAYRAKIQTLREDRKENFESFQENMSSDKSESKLREAHEAMMKAKNLLRRQQFEMALAIRSELTQKQRKEMNELRQNRRNRLKDGFGRRGGKGRGPQGDGPPEDE